MGLRWRAGDALGDTGGVAAMRDERKPSPWAVICHGPWDMAGGGCGKVYLTEAEYMAQMSVPTKTWRCPECRYEADWDDDNYEASFPADEAQR